ncbi:hypothetical protein CK203_091848 [Vitis vinifera]|uniref:Uncharacterized protein n=1 Tax=Vitis vinifera TaxID=29760 RepID=A0A438BM54_VITVI|nr:hypothetical protein CK203_091848 [Vitis vinifera]
MLLFLLKGSKMKDEAIESVSAGLSYSIEINDAYIPPWIISMHRINIKVGITLLNGGKSGFKNGSAVVLMVVRRAAGCSRVHHGGANSTLILQLL